MLQDKFRDINNGFVVGELVKPKEPNDIEAISCGDDTIGVGIFVKKVLNSQNCETVQKLVKEETLDKVFGITLDSTVYSTSCYPKQEYHKGEAVVCGRVTSKLSVLPKIIKADGLLESDILTAGLYIIAGGANSGALYVSKTSPSASDNESYITCDSKYRLRVDSVTQEVYLEII